MNETILYEFENIETNYNDTILYDEFKHILR